MQSLSPGSANNTALLQLLEQAIGFHSTGQLDKAVRIYREVLAQDPVQAIALHYLGIFLHQNGEHEEGVQNIRLSCALQPDNAGWYNDLGNVLFALREFEDATEAYQSSLEIDARDHVVWNNLGSSQMQHNDTEGAIQSFKQAVELAPDFGPALIHLGNIYEAAGDKMACSHYQCRAFVLPPLEGKSKEMLGISFYFLGRLEEAADIYRAWMDEEPGNPIASHMYAACSQVEVPMRASDHYVEKHFDRYAETFNANLVDRLAYRGPELIGKALATVATGNKQFKVLDIGCGTGLCAPVVAPYAHEIIGVDLSGKMLEQAQLRGGYDQLIKQEITEYMAAQQGMFDLVLSADTMIYFGHLEQVFQAVAGALRNGGYFIFTVEAVMELDRFTVGYQLHPSGRYRHSAAYVRLALAKAGLVEIGMTEEILREEIREPVTGMLIVAQRQA